jgi:epoxyqueuosine reductase
VTIPVAEELETVPGIPKRPEEVDWYSREYPPESHNVENRAYRQWVNTISDIKALRTEHERLNKPWVVAARVSGDIEPTVAPVPGKDVTQEIKQKARELGFAEVGIAAFDFHYVFESKKKWVKYSLPHAICLVLEQAYEQTQTAPSGPAEAAALATYRREGEAALELADFIRSLGYCAQVHSPNDASCVVIPMCVQAGLGQLGANGQLLSPHFGSRARLMLIGTDALVTYDQPVDYGIHKFCQICQVCVNRCPGRALQRDKVWWRGVEKNKLITKRCRPVMARYAACGVCQKVCPIQKFGMKAVMEHFIDTGQVLGKGTDALEGYTVPDKGYFGPGELPLAEAAPAHRRNVHAGGPSLSDELGHHDADHGRHLEAVAAEPHRTVESLHSLYRVQDGVPVEGDIVQARPAAAEVRLAQHRTATHEPLNAVLDHVHVGSLLVGVEVDKGIATVHAEEGDVPDVGTKVHIVDEIRHNEVIGEQLLRPAQDHDLVPQRAHRQLYAETLEQRSGLGASGDDASGRGNVALRGLHPLHAAMGDADGRDRCHQVDFRSQLAGAARVGGGHSIGIGVARFRFIGNARRIVQIEIGGYLGSVVSECDTPSPCFYESCLLALGAGGRLHVLAGSKAFDKGFQQVHFGDDADHRAAIHHREPADFVLV